MLQEPLICLLVAIAVAVAQNFPQGGGGFSCPQPTGSFDFPGDCTRFYHCNQGTATVIECSPQLIYNPQTGVCDWPHRAPNPGCAPNRGAEAAICQVNPYGGNPEQAFHIGHDRVCNAFYTCSPQYVFAPCTFCPEGMYFDLASGGCRDYMHPNLDVTQVCQGREFVQHHDKVARQVDGTCWPFSNTPNPFQAVADAIRGGGGGFPPRQGPIGSFPPPQGGGGGGCGPGQLCSTNQGFIPAQNFNPQSFNPHQQQPLTSHPNPGMMSLNPGLHQNTGFNPDLPPPFGQRAESDHPYTSLLG